VSGRRRSEAVGSFFYLFLLKTRSLFFARLQRARGVLRVGVANTTPLPTTPSPGHVGRKDKPKSHHTSGIVCRSLDLAQDELLFIDLLAISSRFLLRLICHGQTP
tara:strand:- start:1095 stop:1409 length:315 start_codon:yes stop_codon:yes gene_type:complete